MNINDKKCPVCSSTDIYRGLNEAVCNRCSPATPTVAPVLVQEDFPLTGGIPKDAKISWTSPLSPINVGPLNTPPPSGNKNCYALLSHSQYAKGTNQSSFLFSTAKAAEAYKTRTPHHANSKIAAVHASSMPNFRPTDGRSVSIWTILGKGKTSSPFVRKSVDFRGWWKSSTATIPPAVLAPLSTGNNPTTTYYAFTTKAHLFKGGAKYYSAVFNSQINAKCHAASDTTLKGLSLARITASPKPNFDHAGRSVLNYLIGANYYIGVNTKMKLIPKPYGIFHSWVAPTTPVPIISIP